MISVFHKNQKLIVIISAVIIFLFILSSIGYMGFEGVRGAFNGAAVAKVGDAEISGRLYNTLLNMQARQMAAAGAEFDDASLAQYLKMAVLSSLVREEAFYQSAKKMGLGVSDYQIGYTVQSMFNIGGIFNKQAYIAFAKENYRMRPQEFEALLEHNLTAEMFTGIINSPFKVTPAEAEYSYKTQNGSMKNYAKDKALFLPTVAETKNETAARLFFDNFASNTEIQEYNLD